jgi:hypothetical protein
MENFSAQDLIDVFTKVNLLLSLTRPKHVCIIIKVKNCCRITIFDIRDDYNVASIAVVSHETLRLQRHQKL